MVKVNMAKNFLILKFFLGYSIMENDELGLQTGGGKVPKKGQKFHGRKVLSVKKTKNGAVLAKFSGKQKGTHVYRFVKGASPSYMKKLRTKRSRSASRKRSNYWGSN